MLLLLALVYSCRQSTAVNVMVNAAPQLLALVLHACRHSAPER